MKKLSFVLGLSFATVQVAIADTLTLRVEIVSNEGTVRAAIYDSQKAFDSNKMILGTFVQAQQGTTQLKFENLNPGTYGIALFHDVNGNEKLDRNLLGAPNEPFGFSQNPKIGFSAPSFDKFKFEFDGSPKQLEIILNGN